MSDADLEVIQDTGAPASPETLTWARKLMDGVRAVQALHRAIPYDVDGADGTTMGCAECTRVIEFAEGDTIEEWPCATAKALGIAEGPVL